ncbi:MAG: hypothetical protein WA814_07065 [Candidatus Baltobacteraceae bacterium]
MDARLIPLMGSFIGARAAYTLARLEFAIHAPKGAAPPVVGRLAEPSERALREDWPQIERELEQAMAFAREVERSAERPRGAEEGYLRLERALRELDQYARAIRWVLTVTERPGYDL